MKTTNTAARKAGKKWAADPMNQECVELLLAALEKHQGDGHPFEDLSPNPAFSPFELFHEVIMPGFTRPCMREWWQYQSDQGGFDMPDTVEGELTIIAEFMEGLSEGLHQHAEELRDYVAVRGT